MEFVTIVSKKATNLADLKYLVQQVSSAIGTWLLPDEELNYSSIRDLADSWIQINLGRTFSEGFSEAGMSFYMGNHHLSFQYCSTSSTIVEITIELGDDQNPETIRFKVYLPYHRVNPNRVHFETLTSKFGLNDDLPCYPAWVQKKEFEDHFVNNSVEFFQERNFQQVQSEMGLVWKCDNLAILQLDTHRFLLVWNHPDTGREIQTEIESFYDLHKFLQEKRHLKSRRKRRKMTTPQIDESEYEELDESEYEDEDPYQVVN